VGRFSGLIDMAMTLGGFCLAIVIVSVLGGLFPLGRVLNHTRLQVYLSFSAGTMLGAVFFHMMPEAVRVGSSATISWAAVGLLVLFFLERFFSFHQHEAPNPDKDKTAGERSTHEHHHEEPCATDSSLHASPAHSRATPSTSTTALSWGSAAFGLVVHSLVGGVALASAVAADYGRAAQLGAAGLGVFVATLVHKPADALTITSLMLRGGAQRRTAHLVNLGFALMIPAGVIVFALGLGRLNPSLASKVTAGALAFSAGTFLCIALSDLLPELQFHSHDRFKLSLALLLGFGLMAGAAFLEPDALLPDRSGQAAGIDQLAK
jgi:zinc and cadmium transporter